MEAGESKIEYFFRAVFSIVVVAVVGNFCLGLYIKYWRNNIYPTYSVERKAELAKIDKMTEMEYLEYSLRGTAKELGLIK